MNTSKIRFFFNMLQISEQYNYMLCSMFFWQHFPRNEGKDKKAISVFRYCRVVPKMFAKLLQERGVKGKWCKNQTNKCDRALKLPIGRFLFSMKRFPLSREQARNTFSGARGWPRVIPAIRRRCYRTTSKRFFVFRSL